MTYANVCAQVVPFPNLLGIKIKNIEVCVYINI